MSLSGMQASPKLCQKLALGVSALVLAVATANAAPLVKECSKSGQFVIGFSKANNAEPYRQHVNDDMTAAAKKVPQFTLQIADGAGSVNTQTSQMDNFITQKVDLILISPFEAAPLTPVVARATKAGIPVMFLAPGNLPSLGDGRSVKLIFLTSAAEAGASVLKMVEVSRHKSVDVLRGYIRRADLLREHAGAAFL